MNDWVTDFTWPRLNNMQREYDREFQWSEIRKLFSNMKTMMSMSVTVNLIIFPNLERNWLAVKATSTIITPD